MSTICLKILRFWKNHSPTFGSWNLSGFGFFDSKSCWLDTGVPGILQDPTPRNVRVIWRNQIDPPQGLKGLPDMRFDVWFSYLHEKLICMVNVGTYTIHWVSGLDISFLYSGEIWKITQKLIGFKMQIPSLKTKSQFAPENCNSWFRWFISFWGLLRPLCLGDNLLLVSGRVCLVFFHHLHLRSWWKEWGLKGGMAKGGISTLKLPSGFWKKHSLPEKKNKLKILKICGSQKESNLPTIHFQGRTVSFR